MNSVNKKNIDPNEYFIRKIKLEKIAIKGILLFTFFSSYNDTFSFFTEKICLCEIPFVLVYCTSFSFAYIFSTVKLSELTRIDAEKDHSKTSCERTQTQTDHSFIQYFKSLSSFEYGLLDKVDRLYTKFVSPWNKQDSDIDNISPDKEINEVTLWKLFDKFRGKISWIDIFSYPNYWSNQDEKYNQDFVIRYLVGDHKSVEIKFSKNYGHFYLRKTEQDSSKFQGEEEFDISQLESKIIESLKN